MTAPDPIPADLREALDERPTEAEIAEMRTEAGAFRLPAPPPIPVRGSYYLTECEYCGWVGSSEQCGTGGVGGYAADDIICPVCCSSIAGDAPSEADAAAHGEAVHRRIVAAEAERDAPAARAGEVMADGIAWYALAENINATNRRLCAELSAATARAHEAEARASVLEKALRHIDDLCPVTCGMTTAHEMADTARQALENKP